MFLDSSPERSRTSPDLKWLLNQRAAYLGALQQAEARTTPLQRKLALLEAQVAKLSARLEKALEPARSIQRDIQALDVVIDAMHGQVNKDAVEPVKAWAGRYGARGARKQFIITFLQAAYPHPVKTKHVLDALIHRFNIPLETSRERTALRHSVLQALVKLRDADGVVVSLHVRKAGTPDGLWRWKEPMPTLEQLRARTQERDDDLAEDRPAGEVGHQ